MLITSTIPLFGYGIVGVKKIVLNVIHQCGASLRILWPVLLLPAPAFSFVLLPVVVILCGPHFPKGRTNTGTNS